MLNKLRDTMQALLGVSWIVMHATIFAPASPAPCHTKIVSMLTYNAEAIAEYLKEKHPNAQPTIVWLTNTKEFCLMYVETIV